MDKYNSAIGKLAGRIFCGGRPYAITLGQTTHYSCPIELVTPRWRRHETTIKRGGNETEKSSLPPPTSGSG